MGKTALPIALTIGFSLVGVLGDYWLKLASGTRQPFRSPWFYLGFAVYGSTALGWLYVMRHLKLATISVVYAVSMICCLTALGVLVFKESLNAVEALGLAMALGSLVLLTRFA
jgi:drug/metabolite transporter (DMT)-like permease